MRTTIFNYKVLVLLFISLLFLAGTGCKKKEEEQPVAAKTVLMTVNFTDNFINPKLGAIVFVSDSAGNVLADTTWKGNGKIRIYARPGIKIPSTFTLTFATWEPSMHNFDISMKSYTDVSPGEWTLQGHRPDTLGHFTMTLSNVPQGALLLYANAGFANLTTVKDHAVDLSYMDPDELYINMEVNQTQKYLWVGDIHPGGQYEIDMSAAVPPAFSTITLAGSYYEARIWGFKNSDYENSLPVMTNFSLGNVPAGNQIKVPVLPEHFQGYHTELKLIESWDSNATYTCRMNGEIPAAFQKINARIASKAISPAGKAEIHPSGIFTTTAVTWQFLARNNQSFTWTIYGSNSRSVFTLPPPSPYMQQTFPILALDSLTYYNIELSDYPGIASYSDFLKRRFDPAQPHSQEKLDASTLISGQAK